MKKLEFNLRTVLVKTIAQADVEFLQTLKFLNFNRSTAKTHVNNLKNSFLLFGTASATIVIIETKSFGKVEKYVADGQHRLLAALELGLPLNVNIVRLEDDTITNVVKYISMLNNTSRGWVNEQYLTSYSACGLKVYKKLDKVKKESKLKMTDLHFIFLQNNTKLVKAYKSGELTELPNEKRSMEIYEATLKVFNYIPNKAFTRRALYRAMTDVKDLNGLTDRIIETSNKLAEAKTSFSENETEFFNHITRLKNSSPKIK